VVHEGNEIELFSEREITHMADVKDVINLVFDTLWVIGTVVIVVVAAGFFLLGRGFLPLLRSGIVWSTIAGLSVAALFGLATLIDFDTTFRLFHEVTFRNDFWKLSPSQSVLLRLFPQGFWFAATLMLVVGTAVQLGVVYGIAWWASRARGV
jgi:integral membrane protein (TIGR01906 family)